MSKTSCVNWPTIDNSHNTPMDDDDGAKALEAKRVNKLVCSFSLATCLLLQCVTGVYDFPSALLFSIETMTTIG